MVYMYHSFLVHSSADGHLGCFHVLGREVGGGIEMGKTCEPKAFSFQCMTEFTTKKKKKEQQPSPGDTALVGTKLLTTLP